MLNDEVETNDDSNQSNLLSNVTNRRICFNLLLIGIVTTFAVFVLSRCNKSTTLLNKSSTSQISRREYDNDSSISTYFRRLNGNQQEALSFFERITSTRRTCAVQSVGRIPPLPGKKGVAMTLRDEGEPGSWVENLPKVISLNPYWNYSWNPKRISKQPNNIEFIPMLWGGNSEAAMETAIKTYIQPQINRGTVKRVLAFNEPDHYDQSNMDVAVALSRWKRLESLKVPLVSPSCAHPGREWMKSFMSDVEKTCKRVDWVGVHWYGNNYTIFKSEMRNYYQLYQRPILITEFALADWSAKSVSDNKITKADTMKFMKQALPWLEKQTWIVGYAWFSFKVTDRAGTNSALFDENGAITALGRYYSSVRKDKIQGDQSTRPDK